MTGKIDITFASTEKETGGVAVFLVPKGGAATATRGSIDPSGIATRAAALNGFSGKAMATLDVTMPEGGAADRILLVGLGEGREIRPHDWLRAGGAARAKLGRATRVTVRFEAPGVSVTAKAAADFALGMLLRGYSFDTYKTKKTENGEDTESDESVAVTILVEDPAAAKKAFGAAKAVAEGVMLARDLVNEPANILGPLEFADRTTALEKLGVDVEILTEKDIRKLGMGALLGVAQGSDRPPRLVVMRWDGGKGKEPPVAFIGKGVVFDTGGISIKPSAGMEDMKGDMGGAAAVTGLMHVLAARKAKVNAVGIIGLVENMPGSNAQRPGDIVTTMSGQTVEVINTDAEGRLVLCDALWYCQDRFKPQFMVNLATLTGAVIVALGHHHAGLFSNDDQLSARLTEAGIVTEEKLWRMPLGPEYDKMLESKFADMKNIGGRWGGSITAAQFLQRFVNGTPWAHLDIAGTAMGSQQTEINQSWGSGFGVRLLDELVRAHYEA
ncbi:MAG: leucyl aminopeptidase [Pararhizobium sp.]